MKKGNLNRAQAVAEAGEAAVSRVESINCEPTNRVGYNGACQGDAEIEWRASTKITDGILEVYYYTDADDADDEGMPSSWEIEGYEII
jgi:hypothetical protein